MRLKILILALISLPLQAFGHGGGLNSEGCHKNNKTHDYHCHRSQQTGNQLSQNKQMNTENSYNRLLAARLNGRTEVTYKYTYNDEDGRPFDGQIRIDVTTSDFVIEGGLDKRSSLDSLQQAIFASTIADKKPAIAIYDTDGKWGRYEHRIWVAANAFDVKFIWFDGKNIKTPIESSN